MPDASVAVQETTSPSNNSGGASFSTVTVPGQASEADKAGKLLLSAKFSPGSAFRVTVGGQLLNTGFVTSGEHGLLQTSEVPVLQSSSMLLPHTSVARTTITVRVQVIVFAPTVAVNGTLCAKLVAFNVTVAGNTVIGLLQLSVAVIPRLAGEVVTEAGQPGTSVSVMGAVGQLVNEGVAGVQTFGGVTITVRVKVSVLLFSARFTSRKLLPQVTV